MPFSTAAPTHHSTATSSLDTLQPLPDTSSSEALQTAPLNTALNALKTWADQQPAYLKDNCQAIVNKIFATLQDPQTTHLDLSHWQGDPLVIHWPPSLGTALSLHSGLKFLSLAGQTIYSLPPSLLTLREGIKVDLKGATLHPQDITALEEFKKAESEKFKNKPITFEQAYIASFEEPSPSQSHCFEGEPTAFTQEKLVEIAQALTEDLKPWVDQAPENFQKTRQIFADAMVQSYGPGTKDRNFGIYTHPINIAIDSKTRQESPSIDELPLQFSLMSHLNNLILSGTNLKKLPDEIFQGLFNLTTVFITNNPQISEIPDLSQLTKLRTLYFNDNSKLKTLPSSLKNCDNMIELFLKKHAFSRISTDDLPTSLENLNLFHPTPAIISQDPSSSTASTDSKLTEFHVTKNALPCLKVLGLNGHPNLKELPVEMMTMGHRQFPEVLIVLTNTGITPAYITNLFISAINNPELDVNTHLKFKLSSPENPSEFKIIQFSAN